RSRRLSWRFLLGRAPYPRASPSASGASPRHTPAAISRASFALYFAFGEDGPMRFTIALATLLLAACQPAPKHDAQFGGGWLLYPKSLEALHKDADWLHGKGSDLQDGYEKSAKALLMGKPRPDAIGEIKAAGYECIYGEAHENYPDPAAQCTRSFATPECQM